jgi:DNA-binding NarL/FixJ family response regulator
MRNAMSSILILAFAIGIPTCILSYFALNARRRAERCFLAFQTGLLSLMLFEALVFLLFDTTLPNGRALMLFFLAGCRASLAEVSIALFLLTRELFGIERRGPYGKASSTCFCLVSIGLCCYTVIGILVNPEIIIRIRYFDPLETLGYAIILLPIALSFAGLKRIQDKRLAKALRAFLALGAILIPAAILEDLIFSKPKASDLTIVLPLWYLAFNGLVLYFGIKHVLYPRFAKEDVVDAENVQRVSSRFNVSAREREVLSFLIEGLSNKEIADRLNISPATVRNHVHSIFEKTDMSNRVELTRLFTRH